MGRSPPFAGEDVLLAAAVHPAPPAPERDGGHDFPDVGGHVFGLGLPEQPVERQLPRTGAAVGCATFRVRRSTI